MLKRESWLYPPILNSGRRYQTPTTERIRNEPKMQRRSTDSDQNVSGTESNASGSGGAYVDGSEDPTSAEYIRKMLELRRKKLEKYTERNEEILVVPLKSELVKIPRPKFIKNPDYNNHKEIPKAKMQKPSLIRKREENTIHSAPGDKRIPKQRSNSVLLNNPKKKNRHAIPKRKISMNSDTPLPHSDDIKTMTRLKNPGTAEELELYHEMEGRWLDSVMMDADEDKVGFLRTLPDLPKVLPEFDEPYFDSEVKELIANNPIDEACRYALEEMQKYAEEEDDSKEIPKIALNNASCPVFDVPELAQPSSLLSAKTDHLSVAELHEMWGFKDPAIAKYIYQWRKQQGY